MRANARGNPVARRRNNLSRLVRVVSGGRGTGRQMAGLSSLGGFLADLFDLDVRVFG